MKKEEEDDDGFCDDEILQITHYSITDFRAKVTNIERKMRNLCSRPDYAGRDVGF
jgi:hypothetical protein